ncbi:MAG: hypothetical protein PUC65_17275 [Clostridiales bacterium]|nr:hypothetical protein [Clostridiales bacterium]
MRKSKKILIVSAVAGLAVVGTTAGMAYCESNNTAIVAEAATNTDTTDSKVEEINTEEILDKLSGKDIISTDAAQKEETVYVIADATGASQKIIVSEWLKNPENAAELVDQSNLTDIQNVKGEETFTLGAEGQVTWAANGQDIYYQGQSSEELPLKLNINYTLDGNEITPAELEGKSGKLVMTFSYDNIAKVPFLAVNGMILDNSKFTNVNVTNGKVVNDGSKIVVIGAALPGVAECLDIDTEKADIPSTVEVTADVTDYSAVTSMTLVTNDLFNHINVDNIDDMDSLKDAMSSLTDATTKLVDGSDNLYDGLCTLADKSVELSDAIGKLSAGADKLQNGIVTAQNGIGTLSTGIGSLDQGIGALNSGVGALDQGISKFADGIVQLDTGINSLADGSKNVQSGAGQIKDGLGALAAQNDTLNGGAKQVFNSLLANAQSQLTAAGVKIPNLTIENYEKVLGGVIAQLNQAGDAKSAYAAKTIQGVLDSLKSYQQFYDGLAQYTGAVSKLHDGSKTLAAGTDQLTGGVNKLSAGSSELVKGFDTLQKGSSDLVDGSSKLVNGSAELVAGASKLNSGCDALVSGSKELAGGLGKLDQASGTLIDGVGKLKDGSKQLADGIELFSETGIQKLSDMFDGDISKLITNVSDMISTSKEYVSFGGVSKDMTGSVKFIIKAE